MHIFIYISIYIYIYSPLIHLYANNKQASDPPSRPPQLYLSAPSRPSDVTSTRCEGPLRGSEGFQGGPMGGSNTLR